MGQKKPAAPSNGTAAPADLYDKIDDVLFPTPQPYQIRLRLDPDDAQHIKTVQVGLVPLPIKQSRLLSKMMKPFEDGESITNEGVADIMVSVVCQLLTYYGVRGASREVIEDSLSTAEIQDFIEAQLQLQKESDFLLIMLSAIFAYLRAAAKKAKEALTTAGESTGGSLMVPPAPSPTPASVKPGASPSTPSSAAIPLAS